MNAKIFPIVLKYPKIFPAPREGSKQGGGGLKARGGGLKKRNSSGCKDFVVLYFIVLSKHVNCPRERKNNRSTFDKSLTDQGISVK